MTGEERIRALVIEGEPEQAHAVQMLLETNLSASADTAESAAAARELLSRGDYDLVTLDYVLPDVSGLDLLSEILESEASPVVIIVTGRGDENVAAEALRLGASGYVVKDERLPELLEDSINKAMSQVRNITDLEEAQEEVEIQRDLAVGAVQAGSLQEVLDLCLDAAIRLSKMDSGAIFLADETSGGFELACSSGFSAPFIDSIARLEPEHEAARLARAGGPRYSSIAELVERRRSASGDAVARSGLISEINEGMKGVAVIPVSYDGKVIASLNIASHTKDSVPVPRRAALESIAAQMGIYITYKQAEETAHMNAARAETLDRVSREFFGTGPDYRAGLVTISRSLTDLIGDCAIILLSEDQLSIETVIIEHREEGAKEYLLELFDASDGKSERGLVASILSTRELQQIPILEPGDLKWLLEGRFVPYLKRYRVSSIIIAPLRAGEMTIGVLSISRDETSRPFTQEDHVLVQDLADRAAMAIEAARLHKQARDEVEVRREREEELESANLELQGFAHTVSHDLKGPLSTIKLSLELLKERRESISEETGIKIIESLTRNAGKAYSLVENLLALAESGVVPRSIENLDVSDVVQKVIEDNDTEISSHGVLVKLDNDMGRIRANKVHISQIFSNLVLNAVRHNRSPAPELTISYLGESETGVHKYLVRDNGQGLPEGIMDNLFEPFVKGEGGGTGIGLAIVEKVIRIYGGSIRAYNEDGARFEFTLNDLSDA